jgi:hypothetical protein
LLVAEMRKSLSAREVPSDGAFDVLASAWVKA